MPARRAQHADLQKIRRDDRIVGSTQQIAATDKPPLLDSPVLSVSSDGKTILYAKYDQNAGSIMIADLGK